MKFLFSPLSCIAAIGVTLFATAEASAARPATLANTTWNMQLNGQPATLVIETQGGPGGPGGPNCLAIRGHFGASVEIPVHGWYCSATGRIHFIHSNLNSLVTMRTFSGNVSDVVAESTSMAGTMTVDNVGFGELGEFPFSGTE
jgi:hypothetical protein